MDARLLSAVFADRSYSRRERDALSDLPGWTEIPERSDDSLIGFHATAFKNASGEVVIAFRGSDSLLDTAVANTQLGPRPRRPQGLWDSAAVLLFLGFSGAPLAGCSDTYVQRSQQEVELTGGGTVAAFVRQTYQVIWDPVGPDAYIGMSSQVELKLPQAETVTWEGFGSPVLLDLDPTTQRLVLITSTSDCGTWRAHGAPIPPYWAYELVGSEWTPRSLPEWAQGRYASFLQRRSPDNVPRRTAYETRKINSLLPTKGHRARVVGPESREWYCN